MAAICDVSASYRELATGGVVPGNAAHGFHRLFKYLMVA